MLDDLRVEDNLPSISSGEGLPLQSMIETKVVGARCEHPRLEDTRQLLTSFHSDVQHVVGPGIPRPTHSHEVVPFSKGVLFEASSRPPRWVLDCLCDGRRMRHVRAVLSDSITIFLCVPCR